MHHHGSHDPLGFWSLLSPTTLLLTVLVAVVYFLIIGPLRSRFPDSQPATKKQKTLFVTGLIIHYLAAGPVDAYGHLLFSAHMFQMSLFYLIVPPLFLLGIPAWIWRLLWKGKRKPLLRFLTYPLITILGFNGLVSVYHLPVVFDAIMSDPVWMTLAHVILTVAAFMMWWPIACPVPELDRLRPLQKMAYIFGDGVLLTPACALLAFSNTLLYDTYAHAPQVFAVLQPVDDQQLGGVIMKIIQEVAYGSVLAYTFFQWVRKQREDDEKEGTDPRRREGLDESGVSIRQAVSESRM